MERIRLRKDKDCLNYVMAYELAEKFGYTAGNDTSPNGTMYFYKDINDKYRLEIQIYAFPKDYGHQLWSMYNTPNFGSILSETTYVHQYERQLHHCHSVSEIFSMAKVQENKLNILV